MLTFYLRLTVRNLSGVVGLSLLKRSLIIFSGAPWSVPKTDMGWVCLSRRDLVGRPYRITLLQANL